MCQQIPETFTSQHGYHRDCYQRFSSNLNRLTKPSGEKPSSISSSVREPRRSSTEKDSVLFQPYCIFCNKSGRKSIKVRGSWTTESTTSFAFGGGGRILEVATEKMTQNYSEESQALTCSPVKPGFTKAVKPNICRHPKNGGAKIPQTLNNRRHLKLLTNRLLTLSVYNQSSIDRFLSTKTLSNYLNC